MSMRRNFYNRKDFYHEKEVSILEKSSSMRGISIVEKTSMEGLI